MTNSNQRITKIKRDPIENLLKKAEAMDVADAVQIQEPGMDLTPYPDMNYLRNWVHDYLLTGVNAIYNCNMSIDGETYLTTIVDGLPLYTKLTKTIDRVPGQADFIQPTLDSNGVLGGASFAVSADSEHVELKQYNLASFITKAGNPTLTSSGTTNDFTENNYYFIQSSTDWKHTGNEFILNFTTGSDVRTVQSICQCEYFIAVEIDRGVINEYNWSKGKSVQVITSLKPNTQYKLKCVFTSETTREYYDISGDEPRLLVSITDTQMNFGASYNIFFGRHTMIKGRAFKGTLDLASSGIFKEGKLNTLAVQNPALTKQANKATNEASGYWQSNEDATNHYLIYYNPDPIKLDKVGFNCKSCTNSNYIPNHFKIQGSNTGTVNDWVDLKTIQDINRTAGKDEFYTFDINAANEYKYFRLYVLEPMSTVQVGYMKLIGTSSSGLVNVVTSKPGLWLSNLNVPFQSSQAGGWLRSNLTTSSISGEFNNINADVIGNYSFSYFQRGIIHRDSGSTHDDNDSYCQHWSPSALGCISHDSIIIPTNNLRNTYTSYQTLAIPSNPNMQKYSEGLSKDVNFTFVDNTDANPVATTTFNGRVVGDGWEFEYIVDGNHQGSGTWTPDGCDCNAEVVDCEQCPHCWSCVDESIRNSGLCVKGEIKYQNNDGSVCIEAVNECFQSIQASLQPDNPYTTDVLPTTNANICVKHSTGRIIKNGGASYESCGTNKYIPVRDGGILYTSSEVNYDDYVIEYDKECTGKVYAYTYGGKTVLASNTDRYGKCSPSGSICSYGLTGFSGPRLECGRLGIIYNLGTDPIDLSQPINNINIYFCVTDEKKKQESYGIPWVYTCGTVNRFSFSFSTQPCEDNIFTKSYLVAENVSITALGDIVGTFRSSSV